MASPNSITNPSIGSATKKRMAGTSVATTSGGQSGYSADLSVVVDAPLPGSIKMKSHRTKRTTVADPRVKRRKLEELNYNASVASKSLAKGGLTYATTTTTTTRALLPSPILPYAMGDCRNSVDLIVCKSNGTESVPVFNSLLTPRSFVSQSLCTSDPSNYSFLINTLAKESASHYKSTEDTSSTRSISLSQCGSSSDCTGTDDACVDDISVTSSMTESEDNNEENEENSETTTMTQDLVSDDDSSEASRVSFISMGAALSITHRPRYAYCIRLIIDSKLLVFLQRCSCLTLPFFFTHIITELLLFRLHPFL
jgi:hypothetical protein